MKSARVALGWPRLRRANGVDDVAAGVVGPAGRVGASQIPGDGVAVAASSATGAVAPKVGTDAVGPKTSTSAPNAGATGPRQRLTQALARGATLTRAAQEAGVSPQLAAVMVEQLRRSGSLLGATSLCASGLGACHSLEVDENTAIRCAGCPLSLKRTI